MSMSLIEKKILCPILIWVMLISSFKILINNSIKENFYEKKIFNILTIFFIPYKNSIKIFLK